MTTKSKEISENMTTEDNLINLNIVTTTLHSFSYNSDYLGNDVGVFMVQHCNGDVYYYDNQNDAMTAQEFFNLKTIRLIMGT